MRHKDFPKHPQYIGCRTGSLRCIANCDKCGFRLKKLIRGHSKYCTILLHGCMVPEIEEAIKCEQKGSLAIRVRRDATKA